MCIKPVAHGFNSYFELNCHSTGYETILYVSFENFEVGLFVALEDKLAWPIYPVNKKRSKNNNCVPFETKTFKIYSKWKYYNLCESWTSDEVIDVYAWCVRTRQTTSTCTRADYFMMFHFRLKCYWWTTTSVYFVVIVRKKCNLASSTRGTIWYTCTILNWDIYRIVFKAMFLCINTLFFFVTLTWSTRPFVSL